MSIVCLKNNSTAGNNVILNFFSQDGVVIVSRHLPSHVGIDPDHSPLLLHFSG